MTDSNAAYAMPLNVAIVQPPPVKAILYPAGGTFFAIHLPHYPTRWQRWWQRVLLGFKYELIEVSNQ